MVKAVALFSGGLDSILAALLIKQQGIEVIALHFSSLFVGEQVFNTAKTLSERFFLTFYTEDFTETLLNLVKNASYGYGKHLNPCIDCRIQQLLRAKEIMLKERAQFVVTGEVVGQRPMSQGFSTLMMIEKAAGLSGLVVRPLSGRCLPATVPQQNGWIKQELLEAISGRGRRRQQELAVYFGVNKYLQPAGGCLLTDEQFARRLKAWLRQNDFLPQDVALLKIGRHFRLDENTFLVVGRNEEENIRLERVVRDGDYLFSPAPNIKGPSAILRGKVDLRHLELAAKIVARYCDKKEDTTYLGIRYKRIGHLPTQEEEIKTETFLPAQLEPFRL